MLKEFSQDKKKKLILILIINIVIILIILINIFMILLDYRKSDKLYSNTEDEYVFVSDVGITQYDESSDAEDGPEINWYDCVNVDLEGLQKLNAEIIGWIYFENEEISYPILYSGEDEKYLRTTYTGERAQAGSIFMEGRNTPDFSDTHTIIYGHNMKNQTMFSRLKNYKLDTDYYEEHKYFQIITGEKKYRYQVISCKDVSASGDVYSVYKNGSTDFFMFAKDILMKGSYIDSGIFVKHDDHVVTLSTCNGNDETRFIVSALLVDTAQVY